MMFLCVAISIAMVFPRRRLTGAPVIYADDVRPTLRMLMLTCYSYVTGTSIEIHGHQWLDGIGKRGASFANSAKQISLIFTT